MSTVALTTTSGIRLGCTNFPSIRSPSANSGPIGPPSIGNNGVELLEVDNINATIVFDTTNRTTNGTLLGKNQTATGGAEVYAQYVQLSDDISEYL